MTHYYITWQPEVAEPGDYFLTHIESDRSDLSLRELMDMAHKAEDLEPELPFELCSILRFDAHAVVLH